MTLNHQGTPVLLLVFNRPDTTAKVFEAIRQSRPKRLYVAADGPRNTDEATRCEEAREIATNIDWACEVFTLFHEQNLGCQQAMSRGISWFFEHEPEGIILEDDCVPHPSFFTFCAVLLEKYRDDDRIAHIGGANLQLGNRRGEASYYFSKLTHVWGWAGWRRIWQEYDVQMRTFPDFKAQNYIDQLPVHNEHADSWMHVLEETYVGNIDSWAYPYAYLNLISNRLSIIPNENLISNIGFRDDATHTKEATHAFASLPTRNIGHITHPEFVIPDLEADRFTQEIEHSPRPVAPPPKKKPLLSRAWKSIKATIKG